MPTVSFQPCTENPSYFSEKCNECRFTCLKENSGRPDAGTPKSGLSMPGVAGVLAGAAASVAGYPVASAGLTILGATAIIAKILRKRDGA